MIVANMNLHEVYADLMGEMGKLDWKRACLSHCHRLAWDVLAETEKVASEEEFNRGVDALLAQCSALFVEQLKGLTGFQMNFLRALCDGVSSDFGSQLSGINPTEAIRYEDKSTMVSLVDAMIRVECGQPVERRTIIKGYDLA